MFRRLNRRASKPVRRCSVILSFSPLPTDADNEMITFSSDEELVEALGSFNGDVFRVYVKDLQVDGEQDAAQFVGRYTLLSSSVFKIVIRVKFALYR